MLFLSRKSETIFIDDVITVVGKNSQTSGGNSEDFTAKDKAAVDDGESQETQGAVVQFPLNHDR